MIAYLPNILSFFRFLLAWILVYLIYHHKFMSAFIVVLLSGMSDFLDGYFARKFSKITPIGSWLDPMADKFFFFCLFLSIYFMGLIPSWVVILFLSRDFLIVIGWAILFKMYPLGIMKRMVPFFVSKVNTFFQFLYPFFILVNTAFPGINWFSSIEIASMWCAVVTTVISGFIYLLRFYNCISEY